MTSNDLDRLDALAAKATPGPWTHDPEHFVVNVEVKREHEHVMLNDERTGEPDGPLCDVFGTGETCRNDAAFIAAADPSTVRALIAEVRRLRRRDAMLSESLWQAWKAFHEHDTPEEAMKDAEPFLRSVCIDEGIMGENGGRLAGREWSDNGEGK